MKRRLERLMQSRRASWRRRGELEEARSRQAEEVARTASKAKADARAALELELSNEEVSLGEGEPGSVFFFFFLPRLL